MNSNPYCPPEQADTGSHAKTRAPSLLTRLTHQYSLLTATSYSALVLAALALYLAVMSGYSGRMTPTHQTSDLHGFFTGLENRIARTLHYLHHVSAPLLALCILCGCDREPNAKVVVEAVRPKRTWEAYVSCAPVHAQYKLEFTVQDSHEETLEMAVRKGTRVAAEKGPTRMVG
jgi:hypothetical protein